MKSKLNLLAVMVLTTTFVFGQKTSISDKISSDKSTDLVIHKHSLGISAFMLYNFFPDPADYYLLTYGYQMTGKDKIFAEFNTWKYAEPMGTYGDSEEMYPGFVRAFGIGFGYQRFHWKGLFTTVQATPFLKQYYDDNNDKIQKGFQIYCQLAAGYRFEFFNKRFYIEPAYAVKYWPVDTNLPEAFAKIEDGTPKYIFEPSLNIGFKF